MADRIRETTKADQQREKLMALGKLSAGLAHELNNPASAVRNAAVNLQQAVRALRTAGLHLDKRPLAAEDRIFLARIECDWSKDHPPAALDSLDRSDREEAIGEWLEGRRVQDARQLAPGLVDAGCDLDTLRSLSERFDDRDSGRRGHPPDRIVHDQSPGGTDRERNFAHGGPGPRHQAVHLYGPVHGAGDRCPRGPGKYADHAAIPTEVRD